MYYSRNKGVRGRRAPAATFGFPTHYNTEPNMSSKVNFIAIPCYIAVVVSLININLKIILTIIFVVDDVKNIFLMKISHYLLTVSV